MALVEKSVVIDTATKEAVLQQEYVFTEQEMTPVIRRLNTNRKLAQLKDVAGVEQPTIPQGGLYTAYPPLETPRDGFSYQFSQITFNSQLDTVFLTRSNFSNPTTTLVESISFHREHGQWIANGYAFSTKNGTSKLEALTKSEIYRNAGDSQLGYQRALSLR